jgi:hypothetical protein
MCNPCAIAVATITTEHQLMCRSAVHAVLEVALKLVTSSAAVDAKLYGTVMLLARYIIACNI